MSATTLLILENEDQVGYYTSESLIQPQTPKQYLASIDILSRILGDFPTNSLPKKFFVSPNTFPLPRVPEHKGSEACMAHLPCFSVSEEQNHI